SGDGSKPHAIAIGRICPAGGGRIPRQVRGSQSRRAMIHIPNIPYRAARHLGLWNRRRFVKRLATLPPVEPPGEVPATVYSLSAMGDSPEQAACIRSFLRFVGRPKRFIVISDGSHTAETSSRLEQLSPCVSVVRYDSMVRPNLSARIQQYAAQHFLGKK